MARRAATPVRHGLRFVAHVLMVSGVLVMADAGVTLAWQEPISAFVAGREQRSLERALVDPPARVVAMRPLRGDAIGRLELPTLDRSYYIVEGTDTDSLRKAPGHYPETPLPGRAGTVGIAGHRTTHGAPFRTIDRLRRGDEVVASLPYGRFVYRVERSRIVAPTETWVKRGVGYNRLILSACHPLYSAAQRIVVFARQIRREAPRVVGGSAPG